MKKLFLILLLFVSCRAERNIYKITIHYNNGDKERLYFEGKGNYTFRLKNGCISWFSFPQGNDNDIMCGVRKFKINN